MKSSQKKLIILIILIFITLMIHSYELLWEGLLGHSHLMHVIHGKLCYIPIVLGAFWFGLRGGVFSAAVVSLFSILYIYLKQITDPHDLINEYTEIVFYFALAGFAGFLSDRERNITKEKEQAEQKLHQTERLSMMGHMAASIAHEIKNPLGSIKGAAQILNDQSIKDSERAEFSGIIVKESDRLDAVVRDFLSYSRPAPSRITDVNVCEILNMAQKHLRFEADKHSITIEFNPLSIPIIIKGDSEKLHQVFLNILINAIQAMQNSGQIKIDCYLENIGAEKQLKIEISDNGPGISDEDIDKVFDPFYSTKSQGTGLGLATAQAIISEHSGAIKVKSQGKKGTMFSILLPLENMENN